MLVRVFPLCAGLGLLVLLAQFLRGFAMERAVLTAFGVSGAVYLVCLALAVFVLRARRPRPARAS